jgi:hypothetical protein
MTMRCNFRSPQPRASLRFLRCVTALLLVLLAAAAPPSAAATLTVTNLADSGPGSLRQALADAASGDTIEFSVALNGPIVLASPLGVTRNVIIRGRRNIPLDGGDATRVLNVAADVFATLYDVVIQRGFASDGGGIRSEGNLTLVRCLVRDNHASGRGGGLFIASGSYLLQDSDVVDNEAVNEGGGLVDFSTGTAVISGSRISGNLTNGAGGGIRHVSGRLLTITGSTISGNQVATTVLLFGGGVASQNGVLDISYSSISGNKAPLGGGVHVRNVEQPATFNLSNSIVSANTATAEGGGMLLAGAAANIVNSTIAHNFSGASGGGIALISANNVTATVGLTHVSVAFNGAQNIGGGISVISGSLTSKNTLIARNIAANDADLAGVFVSQGYNLVQTRASSAGYVATDLANGTDPQASFATFNGGPTNTVRLAAASPAVNAIPASNCAGITIDQRGYRRPTAACDIGAFEVEGFLPPANVFTHGFEPN